MEIEKQTGVKLTADQIAAVIEQEALVAKAAVPNPGKTAVYTSTAEDGTVQYVGITDNLEARAAAH